MKGAAKTIGLEENPEKIEVGKGLLLGAEVTTLYQSAQKFGFAIPAVNVADSHGINAALEAASNMRSPIILQISYGGSLNFAGEGLIVKLGEQEAAVEGALSAAKQIRELASHYDIPVVLHTDHAPKSRLDWLEGMVKIDEAHMAQHGQPLFSSHMIDLSREPLKENLKISTAYFARMAPMGQTIEIEVGAVGGEEDGISGNAQGEFYARPEEVWEAYQACSKIGPRFSIAATFGNVHGVYDATHVHLKPKLLETIQSYVKDRGLLKEKLPLRLVFHGSSGSGVEALQETIHYGVVKVNIDTDLQWAQWLGVLHYYEKNRDRLQRQVGFEQDATAPNKAFYDPRKWLRASEIAMVEHLSALMVQLGSAGRIREGAKNSKKSD